MKSIKTNIFLVLLFLLPFTANSFQVSLEGCFAMAGDRYKINQKLLKSIALLESTNNPNAVSKQNSNGTYDIGLMQINSSWLDKLKLIGIDKNDLFHPCTNIQVGAWILAQEIVRFGYTWDAVGAYNAGPAGHRYSLRKAYAEKVKKIYFSK